MVSVAPMGGLAASPVPFGLKPAFVRNELYSYTIQNKYFCIRSNRNASKFNKKYHKFEEAIRRHKNAI